MSAKRKAPPTGLSQRQAAQQLGLAVSRVNRLLAEGRLARLENGRVCPRSVAEAQAVVGRRQRHPAPAPDGDGQGGPGAWTYNEARRRAMVATARMRELELRERRRELIEREAVARTWEQVATATRERLMAVPSAAAMQLGLTPEQAGLLEQLVRGALTELTDETPGC